MNKLSDVKLRKLDKPGKHFDGGGLYLEVTPAGGRYWRQKYRHGGKEKRLAFGVYPDVSLKAARERRDEARAILARGDDPMLVRREAASRAELERAESLEREAREAANSVEAVARSWLAHQSGRWSPGTSAGILASFTSSVFPTIGAIPIAQVEARDVLGVVKAIEDRGAGQTAGRVLQRIRAVFRYAVVHQFIDSNPTLNLKPAEVLKPHNVVHRAAMDAADVPAYLAALNAYSGDPTTKAALQLLMLTALRPGELRGVRWAEVDADAAQLLVPAERMKMKRPHTVPLSRQALEVIESMRPISGTRELLFPSPYYPGQALSENTLNSALARMGYKGIHTAHGFRALFSTVANESGHDADAIERQLAHIERNEVRAAYHRSVYLKQRAELMQWWADWLQAQGPGAPATPTPRGAT
jgi:integrase